MSKSGQLRLSRTRTIPVPNEYVLAISGECAGWSYDEEKAPEFKGRWREAAFGVDAEAPLDLEIGTGNGLHFAHHALTNPKRQLLGIELKYKPLIQTVRRALRDGSKNMRVARYNAYLAHELFAEKELNDVIIFFPDPWEKLRQQKHRLIQDEFLVRMHAIQRPGSRLLFKTDSQDYFQWAVKKFESSPYKIEACTNDLHASEYASTNFITQFESIFLRQGLKIGYAALSL